MNFVHTSDQLQEIYSRLYDHFGSQDWWPADTPFEIMVGAILTQNTNWQNVEKAIANLKAAGLLSFAAMSILPVEELAEYIRPAGYYNIKAVRLQNFFTLIEQQWDGDLEYFLAQPTAVLREHLLSVKGMGPRPQTPWCCMLLKNLSLWWIPIRIASCHGMKLFLKNSATLRSRN